jgi:hypothetical protein
MRRMRRTIEQRGDVDAGLKALAEIVKNAVVKA